VKAVLVVSDPPPARAQPSRAADRDSPNALPLVRAGEALLRASQEAYPRLFEGFEVVFGRTIPDVEELGYSAEQAIIEVLSDVGVLTEPEGWWMRREQDRDSDFYSIVIHFD
jgi:hypothetical protein